MYISYMCSKYYKWFVELGYERLDVNEYTDGSWDIIEYMRTPVIPCVTPWRRILGNMQHVEISKGFIRKYLEEIDLTKKAIWDREERKSQAIEDERSAQDRHAQDSANRAYLAMRNNPNLMERIAKNGFQEMSLTKIAGNISPSKLRGLK